MNSIAFHPSGDFILAGTDQPTRRCGVVDASSVACTLSCSRFDTIDCSLAHCTDLDALFVHVTQLELVTSTTSLSCSAMHHSVFGHITLH